VTGNDVTIASAPDFTTTSSVMDEFRSRFWNADHFSANRHVISIRERFVRKGEAGRAHDEWEDARQFDFHETDGEGCIRAEGLLDLHEHEASPALRVGRRVFSRRKCSGKNNGSECRRRRYRELLSGVFDFRVQIKVCEVRPLRFRDEIDEPITSAAKSKDFVNAR
jgi:hypothetical protein